MPKNRLTLKRQYDSVPDEEKEMAERIVQSFAEKGMTPYSAKTILYACAILVEIGTSIKSCRF